MFVLLSGIAHGLAARWVLGAFPKIAAKHRRAVILLAFLLALLPGAMRAVLRTSASNVGLTVFALMLVEVTAVMISVVPVTLMTVGLRGWDALSARRAKKKTAPAEAEPEVSEEEEPKPAPVGRRDAIERGVGVAVFAATGTALGWGALRGRHAFQLEEVVVRVAGWPKALEGYSIAQISDVHVGAFVGERELDEGLELLKRAKPDLVVATGDLVDFRSELIGALAGRLSALGVRDGVAAILGNHDHYAGPAEVAEGLERAGIRVLCNQAVRVRSADGGGFALLGVDDITGRARPEPGWTGPDLSRALGGLSPDLPRILLAHQPKFLLESAGRVALQLSGHTHGGQINPGFRPADLFMPFVAGRYERNGTTLWVNRGFGVAGPPSRVGAPPEVTKIVIVAA